MAVGGEAVALVGHGVLGVPEQGVGRQHGLQGAHHLSLAGGAFGAGDFGGGGGGVHARQCTAGRRLVH